MNSNNLEKLFEEYTPEDIFIGLEIAKHKDLFMWILTYDEDLDLIIKILEKIKKDKEIDFVDKYREELLLNISKLFKEEYKFISSGIYNKSYTIKLVRNIVNNTFLSIDELSKLEELLLINNNNVKKLLKDEIEKRKSI